MGNQLNWREGKACNDLNLNWIKVLNLKLIKKLLIYLDIYSDNVIVFVLVLKQ